MPFYEFECKRGHITEELVPIGTDFVGCTHESKEDGEECMLRAHRILSPTPTTFVCAGGRKL